MNRTTTIEQRLLVIESFASTLRQAAALAACVPPDDGLANKDDQQTGQVHAGKPKDVKEIKEKEFKDKEEEKDYKDKDKDEKEKELKEKELTDASLPYPVPQLERRSVGQLDNAGLSPLIQRLQKSNAALRSALQAARAHHFIVPSTRPKLILNSLKREPDLSASDLESIKSAH
jgi:hypothetical protein